MLTLKKLHVSSCSPEKLANVLKENQQGSRGNYIALINMIRSSEVKQVCILVKNLSVIVAAFDKGCEELVKEILSVDWSSQPAPAQSIFKHFLISLLSSQPFYVNKIITKMLKSLSELGPQEAVVIQTFSIGIIKISTDTVPSCLKLVQNGIKNRSPHASRPVSVHQCYYRNMLALVDVIPALFNDVVFEIVSSLVKIDLDTAQISSQSNNQSHSSDVFSMEEEEGEERKLDLLLSELLTYIQEDAPRASQWCKAILLTFDTLVLPVHDPPHAPLVLFYYFNLYPASRSIVLDYLWSVFVDTNRSVVVRASAVNYLAMFSSVAQCVTLPDFAKLLLSLSAWCHHYILNNKPGAANGIFYSAVQALCQMFCYRHTECIEQPITAQYAGQVTSDNQSQSSKGLIESINFGGLVHSTLNPLRHMSPDILTTFNKVTSLYEIVMCNVIIERNNRLLIPSQQRVVMPFQPCHLPLTSPLISPFYREPVYIAGSIDSTARGSVDSTARGSVDATLEDWDDMLRTSSFSPSFTAMSLEDR